MTIGEALETVDRLIPNGYPAVEKIRWLSKLDGQVYQEILRRGQTVEPESFTGYTADTAQSTTLLVPWPYDYDVYVSYLEAMVHRYNGEETRYNIAANLYNTALQSFGDWYRHEHMPAGAGRLMI